MREIIFRGKRKNNRGWICGSFVKKVSGVYIISESITGCIADYTEHEVYPETVCQYTGLTDKNGRKIFEGDILEIETENIAKEDGYFTVEWSEPGSLFALCGNRYLAHFDNCYEDCREVIGNIFDNPELIGEQPWKN